MGYVAPTEETGLSSKDKAIKHSRRRNIHSIVIKLDTYVGLIRIQVLSINKLCDTNRSDRIFLERK